MGGGGGGTTKLVVPCVHASGLEVAEGLTGGPFEGLADILPADDVGGGHRGAIAGMPGNAAAASEMGAAAATGAAAASEALLVLATGRRSSVTN